MLTKNQTRYNLVVRNKPGELAKLTKLLSEEGVNLCSLMVANGGDKASIQFSLPQESAVLERLWKSGLKARAS